MLVISWILLGCSEGLAPHCVDLDGDGYAPCGATPDCNDRRPDVFPGAVERCDGLDDDCDGQLRDDEVDADEDGAYACGGDCDDADPLANAADWDGDGWTTCEGDCDDRDLLAYPGAPERCDGLDGDCDGVVDDELELTRWYEDLDLDGWGLDASATDACARPSAAHVSVGGDCDDDEPAISPSAAETCDGADNDCDGDVDPGCAP